MLKIEALAYIVVESADPARWQTFAEQMLGMQAVAQGSGLFLKMDERDFRISVVKGESDRYLASGWQLPDRTAFDATVAALQGAGVAVTAGASALAASRKVEAIATFADPRSEERRVGKECVSTCRSRCAQYILTNKHISNTFL